MPTSLDINDITVIAPETELVTVAENVFFKDREEGILRPNTIPMPDGIKCWMRARFMDEDVHFAQNGPTIYLLADTTVFGYCLFKLVSTSENDTTFRVAYQGGNRIITNERRQIIMSNPLQDIARNYNANVVSPMNLGGTAPTAMPAVNGEGITRNIDARRLHSEIQSRGYVAGYVMGNAPALNMTLPRRKQKDGSVTANIVAKESKPSRCLAVMIALPANCVQRNGTLAMPSEIKSGLVDYTDNKTDMIYQAFPLPAAISYISAVGNKLPEYAPNVSNATRQWSMSDILDSKPEVSFVTVKAVENKLRNAKNPDPFRLSLVSTSGRRSLYTTGNIVCLRALEHVSTKVSSDADAYRLNEIAFGKWRYQKPKDAPENALQRAMTDCPTQIWNAKYTVDGKEVDGIGSVFFVNGSTVKSEHGETISVKPLTYYPWWQTGNLKQEMPSRVERIVLRTLREASDDKKEAMVTHAVLLSKDPNNALFKGYQKCLDYFVSTGYITRDKLFALGTRTSQSKARSLALTPEQANFMDTFMRSDEVNEAIQRVRDESANRAILDAAR